MHLEQLYLGCLAQASYLIADEASGVAVVVLEPESDLDQATLIQHCVERLAKFKVPARMHVIDELPRNATGKVLKRELRVMLAGEDSPAIS